MSEIEGLAEEIASMQINEEEAHGDNTPEAPHSVGDSHTAPIPTSTERMLSDVLQLVQRSERRLDNELLTLNE